MSVWYCWWGRRKHLLTPSTETAAEVPRATRADSAAVCEAVAVKWANASNPAVRRPTAAGEPWRADVCGSPIFPPVAAGSTGTTAPGAAALPWAPPEREAAAICIPVFGALDLFAECLRSVLDNTPPEVRVLVADDASEDPAAAALVEEANRAHRLREPVAYVRQPETSASSAT